MPRRARARVLAATTLGALLAVTWALPCRAANVTLQGGVSGSAGWTDNVFNTPDQPTTKDPPRDRDFLFQISPRLELSTVAPRLLERLTYRFTADLFATHAQANSYSNTLDWTGNLAATPNATFVLDVTSVQGKLATLAFNQSSSGAPVSLLPGNSDVAYFSQAASESLDYRPLAAWRITQQLRFNAFVPLERGQLGDAYDFLAEGGFDRIFTQDAVGALLRVDFAEFVPPRNPTTDVQSSPDSQQLLTSLVGRWRRDWSPFWSSEAQLGLLGIVAASSDPTVATRSAWQPSAMAAIRWSKEYGAAQLRYAHDATPNPFIGQTFTSDGVTLQGGLPIVRAHMLLSATAGYQHARMLSVTAGVPDASANLVVADATIAWQPIPELSLFARYSYFRQLGQAPVNDVPATLPSLRRMTAMVGLTFLYPPATRARIATHTSSRVDGADQAAFPELHAPQAR